MNRRESLKLITLGLLSGPEALEELARLNYKRRFFPGTHFGMGYIFSSKFIEDDVYFRKLGPDPWHDMINNVFNSNHKLYIPRKII